MNFLALSSVFVFSYTVDAATKCSEMKKTYKDAGCCGNPNKDVNVDMMPEKQTGMGMAKPNFGGATFPALVSLVNSSMLKSLPNTCSTAVPGQKVPDECCKAVTQIRQSQFSSGMTCPAFEFPPLKIQTYLGCPASTGGSITYGENCYRGDFTSKGWLIPAGVDVNTVSKNANSPGDCGCLFSVTGPGCWAVNTPKDLGAFTGMAGFDAVTDKYFMQLQECVSQ